MAAGTPIGTRIKKRRQVLGMTQEALAARLGVSKSTVANWERGKHFPLRNLGKVEEVLGVSLDGEAAADAIVPENGWEAWVLGHPDIPDHIRRDIVLRNRAAAESRRDRPRQAG